MSRTLRPIVYAPSLPLYIGRAIPFLELAKAVALFYMYFPHIVSCQNASRFLAKGASYRKRLLPSGTDITNRFLDPYRK